MTAETNKLYVKLSASQARKRLKGHGFGVKRVEATGDHQSVIVHTATGGHLLDLESLFADVTLLGTREELGTDSSRDVSKSDLDC